MSKVTYAGYAKRLGYKPLKGHEAEFEALAERLFDIKAQIRFLTFCDPGNQRDAALRERGAIQAQLRAICSKYPHEQKGGD